MPDMPDRTQRLLVVEPSPYQYVDDMVSIRGMSDTFEGTVYFRIKDANGDVLARGFTEGGTLGKMEPFEGILRLTAKPSHSTGTVEVYEISMRNGSFSQLVEIPILFR